MEEAKRFEVVIERHLIVYAANESEARAKITMYLNGNPAEIDTRSSTVKEVIELPLVDDRGPIIDVSPKQAAAAKVAADEAAAKELNGAGGDHR